MRIKGKKRHVRKATCFARALGIYGFTLEILDSDKPYSYMQTKPSGRHRIYIVKRDHRSIETEELAHEMVHLKQHLVGDLAWADYHYLWKGQKYFVPEHMTDEYFLAPWEMEARALESWLVHKWRNRERELH